MHCTKIQFCVFYHLSENIEKRFCGNVRKAFATSLGFMVSRTHKTLANRQQNEKQQEQQQEQQLGQLLACSLEFIAPKMFIFIFILLLLEARPTCSNCFLCLHLAAAQNFSGQPIKLRLSVRNQAPARPARR